MSLAIALKHIADAIKNDAIELDLSDLSLTHIPKEIQNIKNLSVLNLSDNQISKIENLEGLPLVELHLDNNQISKIEGLKNLPLEILYLDNNQISKIEGLEDLALIYLYLSYNLIQKIENLNIPTLKYLSLSHNKISVIENFEHLQLDELDISFNQIEQIVSLKGFMPASKLKMEGINITHKDIYLNMECKSWFCKVVKMVLSWFDSKAKS